jgi:hypothetical protein
MHIYLLGLLTIPVLSRCYIKPALRILFYTLYTHHLTRKLFHYFPPYDPGIILSRNTCIICAPPFTLSFHYVQIWIALIHASVDCKYLQCTIFRTACDMSVLCDLPPWSPG